MIEMKQEEPEITEGKEGKEDLVVVIPTHGRETLLERTLRSVADGSLPPALREVVVVENGERGDAEMTVRRVAEALPVRYVYSEPANKSCALNSILEACSDAFLVFFDDDVRVGPNTLATYARAIRHHDKGFFFGGCCEVDYEEEPPGWLKPFLPPSAVGWSLGGAETDFDRPDFLGFNWAASASDLIRMGGFNEERGPGTVSRGQETDMQERMLKDGMRGRYLPDALVWHYVPRGRCSPEWALRRAEQTAVYQGVKQSRLPFWQREQRRAHYRLRLLKARFLLMTTRRNGSEENRFLNEFRLRSCLGALKGFEMAGN